MRTGEYRDLNLACRSLENAVETRELLAMHAVNHLTKARARVDRNDAKIRAAKASVTSLTRSSTNCD